MKVNKAVIFLMVSSYWYGNADAGNTRTAQAMFPQPAISMAIKIEKRLSEPFVKTELSKNLIKHYNDYLFFSKNKADTKAKNFLKLNANGLVKTGMDAVAQLNISKKQFLPIFTEQIEAIQQSFTASFQPAVQQLIDSMLNDLVKQMSQSQQAQQNQAAKNAVFQVEQYTAADYGEQLQTSNSDLSVEIKKFIIQYVLAYTIASKKDIIVAKYAKDMVTDLIRAYTASQDDEMQIVPLVTNHINAWQNRYVKSFTAAMDELVRYLKAESQQ